MMWTIEKIVSCGEYNFAVVHNHPNATIHGYVLEHRIIMENKIGRLLTENEVVHHINGNKKDNNISNLQLMSIEEHARFHAKPRKMVVLKCPFCEKIFTNFYNNLQRNSTLIIKCCSRSCATKFQKFKKDNPELSKIRMKENLINIFYQTKEERENTQTPI